jgi:hypothetical protein
MDDSQRHLSPENVNNRIIRNNQKSKGNAAGIDPFQNDFSGNDQIIIKSSIKGGNAISKNAISKNAISKNKKLIKFEIQKSSIPSINRIDDMFEDQI